MTLLPNPRGRGHWYKPGVGLDGPDNYGDGDCTTVGDEGESVVDGLTLGREHAGLGMIEVGSVTRGSSLCEDVGSVSGSHKIRALPSASCTRVHVDLFDVGGWERGLIAVLIDYDYERTLIATGQSVGPSGSTYRLKVPEGTILESDSDKFSHTLISTLPSPDPIRP